MGRAHKQTRGNGQVGSGKIHNAVIPPMGKYAAANSITAVKGGVATKGAKPGKYAKVKGAVSG